jgi:predicted dehydrogenase
MGVRLAILDPGHFHAALPLRVRNPHLAETVQVHAPDGPELERFLAMVGRFNRRAEDGTAWQLEVHRSADPLASLLAARDVDVAVLAGRNRGKLARIRALTGAGIHVLADKPWVVEPEDIGHFAAMMAAPGRWADMMTERFNPWSALFARLARTPAVTGGADPARGPVLVFASVHHLAKMVDGVALIRPGWYFDVAQQGEGLVDVTTHLVDQAMLIAGHVPGADLPLLGARRWSTAIDENDFRAMTASAGFPAGLGPVQGGALQLMANGELEFTCAGLPVRVGVEWRLRAEDGRGDRHSVRFHGRAADVELAGDATENALLITPRGAPAAVLAAIAAAAPGATVVRDGDRLRLTPAHTSGHEAHFAQVLAGFLAGLDRPQPLDERQATVDRYRLLSRALASARGMVADGTAR